MTARACIDAIHGATGHAFTDDEADSFVNRVARAAVLARKAEPTLSDREAIGQAAKALTREEVMKALVTKRAKVFADIAADKADKAEALLPRSMSPAKRLDALTVGSERQGQGTSNSTDAIGRALQMTSWGELERDIEKMPGLMNRLSNFFGTTDPEFALNVRKEVMRHNGDGAVEPTGDEGALHAGRAIAKALEDARVMQNQKGAWIAKLEGYAGRQTHDAAKIAGGFFRALGVAAERRKAGEGFDWKASQATAERQAFAQWRDHLLAALDPRTFEGLDPGDAPYEGMNKATLAGEVLKDPADVRELMLHAAFMDIALGRQSELSGDGDHADFRPRGSRAGQVSKARVFIFKDAEAAEGYNEKYGSSSYFAGIMGQLERAARNTALMARWGPNPEAGFDRMKARLDAEARARGSVADAQELRKWWVNSGFEQVNGRAGVPENMRVAQVMRTIRGWEASTKLGSIILSKATDLPLTGQTFKRAGAGFLDGYQAFFGGVLRLGGEDAKQAADALDVGARSFAGHLGSQFLSSDGPPGWSGWATRLMYKLNRFEWFNNGVRRGSAEVLARHLGQQSEHDFDHVNIGTRETMERFGITAPEWDQARAGLEALSDGRKYFGFDHIADDDVALKFRTMVHNILDDTVSEPRARERRIGTFGSKSGTLLGESLRAFLQFKGFINTIVGRHLIPAYRGYAGVSPVALLAHMIIGTTLAGYVSMNAKLIASGKAPHGPVGADLGETAKVWMGALAQGGGLGLYGDFLFGEQNRMGGDFSFGQLGGPVISDAEQVAKIVLQSIHGGAINPNTGHSLIPGELVKMGSSNIPVVNLWYTRLALDYLILWRLQEAASPGFLQKYQDRVENQQGQRFIVPPTSALH